MEIRRFVERHRTGLEILGTVVLGAGIGLTAGQLIVEEDGLPVFGNNSLKMTTSELARSAGICLVDLRIEGTDTLPESCRDFASVFATKRFPDGSFSSGMFEESVADEINTRHALESDTRELTMGAGAALGLIIGVGGILKKPNPEA